VGNQESNSNDTIGYYTVINDIYYKLETPIKALDTCFKSFHALNLQYPQEAEQIWWFIQDFFFKITDESKKKLIGTVFDKRFGINIGNYNIYCNY